MKQATLYVTETLTKGIPAGTSQIKKIYLETALFEFLEKLVQEEDKFSESPNFDGLLFRGDTRYLEVEPMDLTLFGSAPQLDFVEGKTSEHLAQEITSLSKDWILRRQRI